jgi:hypothetical protein
MNRATWAVALAALGCSSSVEDRFVRLPDLPPDVAYVGAIAEDESGAHLRATGLIRVDATRPLNLDRIAEERFAFVRIVGFTEAELAMTSPPTDDVLENSPLRPLDVECAPLLPAAAFDARFDAQGAPAPASARPLNMDYLYDVCPNVEENIVLDVQCRLTPCPGISIQRGCALQLDLTSCGFGRFTGRVHWTGDVCLIPERTDCRVTASAPPSKGTITCSTDPPCTAEVYAPTEEIPLDVTRHEIVAGAEPQVESRLLDLRLRPWHARTGYIAHAAQLNDRLVVATHDGRFQHGAECVDFNPGRFVILDLTTGETAATSTAPPCATHVVPDPLRNTFVAPIGVLVPEVARFSRDGALIARAPMMLPDVDDRYYAPRAAAAVEETDEAVIAYGWARREEDDVFGLVLAAVHRETLASRVLAERVGFVGWSLAVGEGAIAIPNDNPNNISFFDPVSGGEELVADIAHIGSVSVGNISYVTELRRFTLAVTIEEPTLHVYANGSAARRTNHFFEHEAAPLWAASWPGDRSLMLVAAASWMPRPPHDAYLAFYDPARGFLPGAKQIGFGVIGTIVDAEDALWMTLPWEGTVIRVRPAGAR